MVSDTRYAVLVHEVVPLSPLSLVSCYRPVIREHVTLVGILLLVLEFDIAKAAL